MNIIFAGTPEFSVPALQALLDSAHSVTAVYTQPDRPAGRGRRASQSPVKQLALEYGVPVCQPVTLRDTEVQSGLEKLRPDLMVVVAYGLLLPPAVLAVPRRGCVNVHASLLPRWRGAAPIQHAILAGDSETGVCLMQMEAGLDTGPVLACQRCLIEADDTASSLHDRLSRLGGELLAGNLAALENASLAPQPQDPAQVTYAGKIEKADALIDWTATATHLERQVRAYNAWPVAETRYQGRQLRIWEAVSVNRQVTAPPGTVLAADKSGIEVACGTDVLRVRVLQLPGGRPVTAGDFVNAHSLEGVRLGDA
ncbi:MAG: methionyl-tRNA formyltransferase [Gammaproteobacteria bacterium]